MFGGSEFRLCQGFDLRPKTLVRSKSAALLCGVLVLAGIYSVLTRQKEAPALQVLLFWVRQPEPFFSVFGMGEICCRSVYHVNRRAGQIGLYVLHRTVHDPLAALLGAPGHMGRDDTVFSLQQGVVAPDRLRGHDVQAAAATLPEFRRRPGPAPPPSGRGCC